MNRLAKEAHVIEEINGVRCSIVEKNVSAERIEFLKKLLEHNGYTVMVAQKTQAPHQAPPPPKGGSDGDTSALIPPSGGGGAVWLIGVTDITFHAMLAVYERSLFTSEGKIVSIAYWNQESEKEDELYWMRRSIC